MKSSNHLQSPVMMNLPHVPHRFLFFLGSGEICILQSRGSDLGTVSMIPNYNNDTLYNEARHKLYYLHDASESLANVRVMYVF